MSEQEQPPADGALQRHLESVWGNWPGMGNLAAVNHNSLGLRFVITGFVFFLIGGVLAMLVRTQLALPGQAILSANLYNQVFTMHGTVMMFLFAIPVLEGMAMYLVPKMLGARDLLFPRLTALGYYCYLFGGIIVLSSLALGIAPDAGWFMYTPLSSTDYSPGRGADFWLLGITFVEISAVTAGVELTVSILRARAPGMSLGRMPIFAWYILGTSLMIVFGFPPLILASILLELERAAGLPFFSPAAGGDPLLWQHLFWLFGHPEVYIIFLPAAGIVSTLIPVFSGRPIVGYRWLVLAIILTGFISFGLWVHHMFTVGIPHLAQAFFSIASMLVAIPTAIQIFAWLATLWLGRVRFRLPMLWIFGFLVIFVCGGLTGVMLALVPFNWQVHDTHFVVAHLHYVLVGGMYFPLIAGLYYWLPHFSGRMPLERLGHWGFWLTFLGFNTTFLLMHLTGLLGMPRRVYTYEAGLGWDWLNLLSSLGGFVMAAGVAMTLLDLLLYSRLGRKAGRNPWGADTLEWATATPSPPYVFTSIPEVSSRHPLWDDPTLPATIAAGRHHLADTHHQRRETLGSEAVSGKPVAIYHLPGNTWLPLLTSLALALVCAALLIRLYPLALAGTLIALVLVLRWSWENGAYTDDKPQDSALLDSHEPDSLPLHWRTADGPGLWGVLTTLLVNGALYLSLLFGWVYLVAVTPGGQAGASGAMAWLTASGAALTLATLLYLQVVRALRAGYGHSLGVKLWVAALLAFGHCALLVMAINNAALDVTGRAYDATVLVALGYSLLHGALLVIISVFQALRARRGYLSAALPYEAVVPRSLWLYSLAVFWISFAVMAALPRIWQ